MCVCDPLVKDGYEYVEWMAQFFHACAWTPEDQASFFLGLANIGFWLFAQVPQIIINFRNHDAGALSFTFVFTWLLGDICNLFGCILTQQLPTQTYTAIYFIIVDFIMMMQWTYYTCKNKKKNQQAGLSVQVDKGSSYGGVDNGSPNANPAKVLGVVLFVSVVVLRAGLMFNAALPTPQGVGPTSRVLNEVSYSSATGSSLLSSVVSSDSADYCNHKAEMGLAREILGDTCAWISGLLYFFGRIPQVWHNYKRKSVEGLSWPMFACAAMGNLCYGFSIIFAKEDWASAAFWESTFPYILGSWFNLIWPTIVLIQFGYYGWWKKRKGYVSVGGDPVP